MELREYFKNIPKAAIAFSGGTDSVYLLYAALKSGIDIQPYFVKTPFQPNFEMEDAKRAACEMGVSLKILEADHLSEKYISDNPANRCYYCKKFIFKTIKKQSQSDGYTILLDGSNASDNPDKRPGMKAASELFVRSPLLECGINKDEIRLLSQKAGLFTWNKPCLLYTSRCV